MTSGWKWIRWAKTVPPARRKDGKPDTVAQHVLLVLATFADKEGRARPGLQTLATESYLADETVDDALERLVAAGLISRHGSFNGTVIWALNASAAADDSLNREFIQRREQARLRRNERQKRYRERLKVTVRDTVTDDGAGGRDVTVPDTVTWDVRDGAADREVTVSGTVSNGVGHREVTVSTSSSSQVTSAVTAIELPLNCQGTNTLPRLTLVNGHGAGGATFEDFYSIYPRKKAPAEARKAWDKIVTGSRKVPPVDPAVIVAGARRFAAERAGKDPQYTPYPASWLNKGSWADEPDQPSVSKPNGYQPWTNPQDQSAYDEELLS